MREAQQTPKSLYGKTPSTEPVQNENNIPRGSAAQLLIFSYPCKKGIILIMLFLKINTKGNYSVVCGDSGHRWNEGALSSLFCMKRNKLPKNRKKF
jgi:hypothetical protein